MDRPHHPELSVRRTGRTLNYLNRQLARREQILMGYTSNRRYQARQAMVNGQNQLDRWVEGPAVSSSPGSEWIDPYDAYEPEINIEEAYYLDPDSEWSDDILHYEEDEIVLQLEPQFRRVSDANPGPYLMLGVVLIVTFLLVLFGLWNLSDGAFPESRPWSETASIIDYDSSDMREVEVIPHVTRGEIASFFAPSVQYWSSEIAAWAANHNLDPNMVATVMQIESCGDPTAVSRAGATGLFQVMPFHFADGENAFDPDTNALRGMNYLADRLVQTNGDIGRAFAGYNGGHVAAASGWDSWVDETRRYYRWSTGIYAEAVENKVSSETLNAWMAAGGASLCAQAEAELGLR